LIQLIKVNLYYFSGAKATCVSACFGITKIEVGRIMARAALARTESRGSHYREDAPQSDPTQAMSQIIDRKHSDGMFGAHLGEL